MSQLNSGKVLAVGPGIHSNDGKLVPVTVKEGDTVLLPEYGGTEVKLDNKEYVLFLMMYLFIICYLYPHAILELDHSQCACIMSDGIGILFCFPLLFALLFVCQ